MHMARQTSEELKRNLKDTMAQLRTLRDEVRVDLHLAGMEAKDHWKKLEPRLAEAEHVARSETEASKRALDETLEALRRFRDAFKK